MYKEIIMAHKFSKQAAQGDLLITRVDAIPSHVKPSTSVGGRFVLAHSETGHDHVVCDDQVQMYIDEENPFVGYLTVEDIAFIEHLRPFDTHETLELSPGIYRINRQREYTAMGFRRATD
jgi:hypothetical protein